MKVNLCDTCKFEFVACDANASSVVFGCDLEGGNPKDDTVVECPEYVEG